MVLEYTYTYHHGTIWYGTRVRTMVLEYVRTYHWYHGVARSVRGCVDPSVVARFAVSSEQVLTNFECPNDVDLWPAASGQQEP